jgi:hypothetical protein
MGPYDQRAMRAYFRRAAQHGRRWDQPTQPLTFEDTRKTPARRYVTLYNIRGILAVYSVRADDGLRWMKRWPHALREHFE